MGNIQEDRKMEVVLNSFINEYIIERKKHIETWLSLKNGLGRMINNDKIFEDLRVADFNLTKKFRKNLIDKNLSKIELQEMVMYIKNHNQILGFRTTYISLLLAIGAAAYGLFEVFPKGQHAFEWQNLFLFIAFIAFGYIAFSERWNINQKDSIYNELENIIQYEIDSKS